MARIGSVRRPGLGRRRQSLPSGFAPFPAASPSLRCLLRGAGEAPGAACGGYSPKLNAMENVWGFLRANTPCSLVRNTPEDIVDAREKTWHVLIQAPDRSRRIGSRDWAWVRLLDGVIGRAVQPHQAQPDRDSVPSTVRGLSMCRRRKRAITVWLGACA
jgi:hypothetical protein